MKKGFSLVELVVSISLISIIVIMLLQVIISIKDLYIKDNTKTNLLMNQANISYILNTHFKNKYVSKINNCGNNCVTFTYLNGEIEDLKIINNSIIIGDKKYIYDSNTNINSFDIDIDLFDTTYKYNAFLNININITNKLFNDNEFNIKVIYPYDSNINHLYTVN